MGIGIADVTGDARGEVLIVNSDNDQTRLSVFSGQSPELLFTRDIARSAYYYFDNVDVDHDGRRDLVVTGSGTWSRLPHDYWPIENGFISIFLRGSDSLSAEKRLTDGQAFMRPLFADFDGDGIADLLVGRYFKTFSSSPENRRVDSASQ